MPEWAPVIFELGRVGRVWGRVPHLVGLTAQIVFHRASCQCFHRAWRGDLGLFRG